MYNAIVCSIVTSPIPGADRIKLGQAAGYQVIVGASTEDGQLGILLPDGGCVTESFGVANGLFKKHPTTGEVMGGYLDVNGRIRTLKLRKQISNALWLPLSCLVNFRPDTAEAELAVLEDGQELRQWHGEVFCDKYYTPATQRAMALAKTPKDKLRALAEVALPKHYDTAQLRHCWRSLPEGPIVVTEKLHGCVTWDAKITLVDGTRVKIKDIEVGDEILGVENNQIVPSTVVRKWANGPAEKWLKVTGKRTNAGRGNNTFVLRCTPEHHVWSETANEYVQAGSLKVGDTVLSHRTDLGLNPIQYQVLLGKVLGDASIRLMPNTASISWGHRIADEEYMAWTLRALGGLATQEDKPYISGHGTPMLRAHTPGSAWIKKAFEDMGTPKTVPNWVADKLTPLSIAFWYMDDGSLGHSDGQEDRANFAVCSFTREECAVLQAGLARYDIQSVYYADSAGYSRIRLNADEAEKLFILVAPYIPPCMQRKLPERYRGGSGWLPSVDSAEYKSLLVSQVVESIIEEPFDSARHDLETTTGNYFCNGLLVHNSSGRTGNVSVEQPLNWFYRMLNKVLPEQLCIQPKRKHLLVSGTRNCLVKAGAVGEKGMEYRCDIHDALSLCLLDKDEVLYYEIVGFTSTGTPIMARHKVDQIGDPKLEKQLRQTYGDTITYSYGCDPESNWDKYAVYVYRITQGGRDMTYAQMCNRVNQLNIRAHMQGGEEDYPEVYPLQCVPLLARLDSGSDIMARCEELSQEQSALTLDNPREGVCVRVETDDTVLSRHHKYKSFVFCALEGIAANNPDFIDEEDAQ